MTGRSSAENRFNPYAAPTAVELSRSGPADPDPAAEATRRAHLGHEALIRGLGAACLVLAGFLAVTALGGIGQFVQSWPHAAEAARRGRPGWMRDLRSQAIGVGFTLPLAPAGFALGFGLRRLRRWARVALAAALGLAGLAGVGFGLANVAGGQALPGLVLVGPLGMAPGLLAWSLAWRKAAAVSTAEYRAIVARTPHLKYRPGKLVKILVAAVLAAIACWLALAARGFK